MEKIIIEETFLGMRLDAYMALVLQDYSRALLQTWIEAGNILVNGETVKNNYRLKAEDEITYKITEEETEITPVEMDLDIVYEDDAIMVVNKPKNMIVHPSPSTLNQVTLVHGLLAYTDKLSHINGDLRPGIVHRIDKDTSGLLLVAKTDEVHEILVQDLKDRLIDREYYAVVHHQFTHQNALVDAPIGRDPKNRQRMTVTEHNSKEAKTHLYLEELFEDHSLLRCKLDTGRTHQIRVHCLYIKHPIVGDQTYSYKNTPDTNGQLLHAFKLSFNHPLTKERMTFTKEMPSEMLDFLESLRGDY